MTLVRRSLLLFSLAALPALLGQACTLTQTGPVVVKHEPRDEPRLTSAPVSGIYSLYDSWDNYAKVAVPLEKGEVIGFQALPDGRVAAVAGKNSYPITEPDNNHYWRLSKQN